MQTRLVVVGGDATPSEVDLDLPVTIGRGWDNGLCLPHPLVSRHHCRLIERDGLLFVEDVGSLNGTYVGKRRVETTPLALPPGELLTIGTVTFRAVYIIDENHADRRGPNHDGSGHESAGHNGPDQNGPDHNGQAQAGVDHQPTGVDGHGHPLPRWRRIEWRRIDADRSAASDRRSDRFRRGRPDRRRLRSSARSTAVDRQRHDSSGAPNVATDVAVEDRPAGRNLFRGRSP